VMATTTLLTLAYALVMYWWIRTMLTAPVALSQSTCVQQGREFVRPAVIMLATLRWLE